MKKFCNICKEEKEKFLFPKKGSVCKKCLSERHRKWRNKNSKKLKEYFIEWYKEHKEDRKRKCKEYYLLNKEQIDKQNKEYYINNKDDILEKNKNWRKDHKKELNEYAKVYNKRRRKENIIFRIKAILRCRVSHLIKGESKSLKTLELLGCSIEFLKEHLQQTAIKNGYLDFDINTYIGKEYHIDHIIPCSAFNLKCSFHQKLCFNWSNLQILKALENDQKGEKLCWNF